MRAFEEEEKTRKTKQKLYIMVLKGWGQGGGGYTALSNMRWLLIG